MRKLTIAAVVGALSLSLGGTAMAIPIIDYNLGHNRAVPIRSLEAVDTPRHGSNGEIELSGCQLILDKPALVERTFDAAPAWPVQTRMYLQCDVADLLFTGYEWTYSASRGPAADAPIFDHASGDDTFSSGPRVPGQWGLKLVDRRLACKDVNSGDRGTAVLIVTRGTVTLFDTEGREYPAKVLDRSFITCPTL